VADRRVAAAAASVLAALVLAGAAVMTLALRTPASPPASVVAVPTPPSAPTAPVADEPSDDDAAGREPPAVAAADEEPGAAASEAAVAAPEPPRRVAVVATGIAWNDDLAASAAFRLPAAVAFALPADLPTAAERAARWDAAGRAVVLRFAWAPAPAGAGRVIPLDGPRERQAGRMEQQWRALEGVTAAAVIEPHAAASLAPIARNVAAATGELLLLASPEPAPPPYAWRLDAGLLGEAGFEAALQRVVEGTVAGDTLILLIEVYPALMDRLVDWLRALGDHDIALVELDALAEEQG
jgi:hypothetical protein